MKKVSRNSSVSHDSKPFFQTRVIPVALALFAMLFGSGNIIFPLVLGRDAGQNALYAMAGFFLTAVLVPLVGIVAIALFDGDYRTFLGRTGKISGFLLTLLCMALIGPFCIIPRSIAVSHKALQWFIPQLSLAAFSVMAIGIIYAATVRESRVVALLGRFLGPLKLGLLSVVIIKGFFVASNPVICQLPQWDLFVRGLLDGYGTLDLLAAIFFSSLILNMLRAPVNGRIPAHSEVIVTICKAGALGASLLGLVYAGFVLVASWQAQACLEVAPGQLLSTLASLLLGAGGGILASITLTVACLTTAIALTTVFSDYMSKELLGNKISYKAALLTTLGIACVFANFGFEGIMKVVAPAIEVCYPALIVLSITNIIYKLGKLDLGSAPFYLTLFVSLGLQVWPLIPKFLV